MTTHQILLNFAGYILFPLLIMFPLLWVAFYLGYRSGYLNGREELEDELADRAVRLDGSRERV